MASTGHVFPQFMLGLAAGDISLPGGTWKIALSNATGPVTLATVGVSTAKLFTDWTSNVAAEISGTGYTAGGATVSSPTFTAGGSNNSVATFTTATNATWPGASFTANQAILYQSSASVYQLAAFTDFGGAVTVSGLTFTLSVNAAGLLTATVT